MNTAHRLGSPSSNASRPGGSFGSRRKSFLVWADSGKAMKRIWTIVGVRDVSASHKWYQSLFGQPETLPSHDHFGQILDTDGTVLLCLHQWGAHEHPSLISPDEAPPGNGLLLFFRVDDFDMALQRARARVTRFEEEPHVNRNTQTREFSLRDPDGYYVTISEVHEPDGGC
jgi:catechol 2,3-dioxygenase-like lactoylglutathione lyase family enzyme